MVQQFVVGICTSALPELLPLDITLGCWSWSSWCLRLSSQCGKCYPQLALRVWSEAEDAGIFCSVQLEFSQYIWPTLSTRKSNHTDTTEEMLLCTCLKIFLNYNFYVAKRQWGEGHRPFISFSYMTIVPGCWLRAPEWNWINSMFTERFFLLQFL